MIFVIQCCIHFKYKRWNTVAQTKKGSHLSFIMPHDMLHILNIFFSKNAGDLHLIILRRRRV
jgi:hypothetical protein